MSEAGEILKKYWGYDRFRPLQEEIVRSVLAKKDTLALLPTGGGKSICFQVPALMLPGTCLVISPLIALMRDQVASLRKKNISAVAITSVMERRELDIVLENAVQGQYKFIYVSPERLYTQKFRERIPHLNLNLLAVDEAHCISQWGYDFRPAYLGIAEIREIIPSVPVLALTATATSEVVKDIQEKLQFEKENVLRKSFARENLSYHVREEENKAERVKKICEYLQGTGIIYARSRRRTEELSKFLSQQGISSGYYHAGMDPVSREQRQEDWIRDRIRVMVCTNAFGMGIDKPDVRFVIHYDIPENPEAYFQEAGRAGRDEKESSAILLWNESDKLDLERSFESSFPTMEEIKKVYQGLAHFYQLPINSAAGVSFELDVDAFCARFSFQAVMVYHVLKIFQREGWVELSENYLHPSTVMMLASQAEVQDFQVREHRAGDFLKTLLRSYSGVFDHEVRVNENTLAKRANCSYKECITLLERLDKLGILRYRPQSGHPRITFLTPRMDAKDIYIKPEHLRIRKERARRRLDFMLHYVGSNGTCRSRLLLEYFGERDARDCGKCDVCRRAKGEGRRAELKKIEERLKSLHTDGIRKVSEVLSRCREFEEEKVLEVLRELRDNDEIEIID